MRIQHDAGHDEFLDEAIGNLREILSSLGIDTAGRGGGPVIAGHGGDPAARYRILPAGGRCEEVAADTCCIALSVQDAVNFRRAGHRAKVLVCPLVFQAGPEGGSICLVDPADDQSSLGVRRAMLAGRPVVYPRASAYYYQVFHGGVPYDEVWKVEDAQKLAQDNVAEFAELARPTGREAAAGFWRVLLAG